MNTLAWVMILAAAVLIRSVFRGRVAELPEDVRDMLLGAMTGDMEAVREAAGRTGEGLTAVAAEQPAGGESVGIGSTSYAVTQLGTKNGRNLLAEARRLGAGKIYLWGGTFPAGGRGGDCSGLVWRAARNLKLYGGPRFTTYTFPLQSRSWAKVVTDPAPGDICVWQRGGVKGHMGIVSGPGKFYSALSTSSGIREASIKSITGRLTYYRPN